jgi:hypothetical protein
LLCFVGKFCLDIASFCLDNGGEECLFIVCLSLNNEATLIANAFEVRNAQ